MKVDRFTYFKECEPAIAKRERERKKTRARSILVTPITLLLDKEQSYNRIKKNEYRKRERMYAPHRSSACSLLLDGMDMNEESVIINEVYV